MSELLKELTKVIESNEDLDEEVLLKKLSKFLETKDDNELLKRVSRVTNKKGQFGKRMVYEKSRLKRRSLSDHQKGHGYFVLDCEDCITVLKNKLKPNKKRSDD